MTGSAAPGHLAVIGLGFIGRRIARTARAGGWDVTALSRRHVALPGVRVIEGDAADPLAVAQATEGTTWVVFAAGTTKPAESDQDPLTHAVHNLAPVLSALEATAAAGARGFTFLSSGGTVYGPSAPVPTPEDTPLWPISSYGVMKAAAEQYVAMHAHHDGFAADILRCANVFGPGEPTSGSQGLIGIARARLRAGEPVVMFGDGSARRDYLHVDDLAEVVLALAGRPDGIRVLNVGSGTTTSVAEIISGLASALGVEPVIDRRPARESDSPVAELDISRLRELLDFRPRSADDWLATVDPE
ncbi:NAD-dependent epimerase/dehydratase family protein [Nocardioides sp. SYSU D00065]|uniref:NAD-dependent epimerase/dehydratase family protein n=1 Tax=Nocardioides sp. SYSU D00065 TaxID=2817378 RepID=UPI001B327ED4|nr:NAD-dependent epimerase/dehydratase family protein [Nocardioides sp. SYSU D00065]